MATKKRLGILTASTVIAALAGGAAVVGSGSAPTVPGTTVEQAQSNAKQATTSGMPAQTLNVSAASQAFIPLVNVPIHRRREAIWLGRPRCSKGYPMGSWNRRCARAA